MYILQHLRSCFNKTLLFFFIKNTIIGLFFFHFQLKNLRQIKKSFITKVVSQLNGGLVHMWSNPLSSNKNYTNTKSFQSHVNASTIKRRTIPYLIVYFQEIQCTFCIFSLQ